MYTLNFGLNCLMSLLELELISNWLWSAVEEWGKPHGGDRPLAPPTILALDTKHTSSQIPCFSAEIRRTKDETNYSLSTSSFAFVIARTYAQDQFYLSLHLHVFGGRGSSAVVRFGLTHRKQSEKVRYFTRQNYLKNENKQHKTAWFQASIAE